MLYSCCNIYLQSSRRCVCWCGMSLTSCIRKQTIVTLMLVIATTGLVLLSILRTTSFSPMFSHQRFALPALFHSNKTFFSLPSDKAVSRKHSKCDPGWVGDRGRQCSFCHSSSKDLSIYVEDFHQLQNYYTTYEGFITSIPKSCPLPNGAKCLLRKNDETADVVFRMTKYVTFDRPVRYCSPQIFALLHSEAEFLGYDQGFMSLADITVTHHLSSTVLYHDACERSYVNIEAAKRVLRVAQRRKGIAMFLSNCDPQWRQSYIEELLEYVHVDSYGSCFHNTQDDTDNMWTHPNSWRKILIRKAKKYRMLITFENTIQKEYFSEKIFLAYQSGAIPVYWGPSDIYKWVPGNHTFIDASTFNEPKELAAYLKRVVDDDSLFKHHTTNFDWDKTANMIKTHCPPVNYMCGVCRAAYRLREESRHSASNRPCFCNYSGKQNSD